MISAFFRRYFMKIEVTPLGRWGHHWEKKMKYQVYYD
jgi:hypothetical protein